MLPCTYTIGRPSRLASSGVVTSGRDAITYGTSRPCIVRPMKPTRIFAPRCWSESRKEMTSRVQRRLRVLRSLGARLLGAARRAAEQRRTARRSRRSAARGSRVHLGSSCSGRLIPASRWPDRSAVPSRAIFAQQRARVESSGVLRVQRLELPHDLGGADGVDVAERPAAERREPDAEHRADVAVARRAHDALLETAHGLVDHRERAAALDFLRRQRGAARAGGQQRVHRLVHAALLAGGVVEVESLLRLPAEPARREHAARARPRVAAGRRTPSP